jgi:hypothetical protein
MRIELISEEPLTPEELRFLRSQPLAFTRRGVVHFGFVSLVIPPALCAIPLNGAKAQVALAAQYMFYAPIVVDLIVKISREARAWCSLINQGKQSERQSLDAAIKDDGGAIEDETAVNISIPPSAKQTFKVTGTPTDIGEKTYECTTQDDEKSASFRVVPA